MFREFQFALRPAFPPISTEGLPIVSDEIIGMYELLDALEAVIKSADPAKQRALVETIDGYAEHFPDDFYWAVGAQSPSLLSHLLMAIDSASRPDAKSKHIIARMVRLDS
jgi:hypothetical protein